MATEVQEGLYEISTPAPDEYLRPTVNSYLVTGDMFHIIVDAGAPTEETAEQLLDGLAETGVDLEEERVKIILTHTHPDHGGQAEMLKGRFDAPIVYHPYESLTYDVRDIHMRELEDYLRFWLDINGANPESLEMFLQATGAYDVPPIDDYLRGGDVVDQGNRTWEVLWTPGHAPGHISLYDRDRHLLIGGDYIHPEGASYMIQPPWSLANPLAAYFSAMVEVERLDVDLVLPGHGDRFTNLDGAIETARENTRDRRDELLETIDDEPMTAWEITRHQVDPEQFDGFPEFRQGMLFMETLPFAELVGRRDDVEVTLTGGRRRYVRRTERSNV